MQLHSPTHASQFDHHSAIREIRRSLSRSPSKPFNFRSAAHREAPYQPSPLSPSRRSTSDNFLHYQSMSSPQATRSTQTGRIQRPSLRRVTQTVGPVLRTRTSPRSPSKRVLTDSNESAQSSPVLRKRRSTEISDDDLDFHDGEDKENTPRQNGDHVMNWKPSQTKQEKRRSGGLLNDMPPLSPLKRPDTAMNIDNPDFGSPSAKRRSVHGPTTMDFSIFESDNLKDGQEKRSQDDLHWFRNIPMSPSSSGRFSTIPKRSSSLRKSTLQQRQGDRSSPLRLSNFSELRQNWSDQTPNAKKPSRTSLDNHLQPLSRDSPFSAGGDLLNASIHPVTSSQESASQQTVFKHPLSRTMTQSSSSTPSAQDDSPTHEPMRRPGPSRPHDFAKSLPIGALRPTEQHDGQESQFSSQGSFATPSTFKMVKPLPAAFMSTGLISKKNRNIDDINAGLPKSHMPDTPCKKQTSMFPPDKIKPKNAAIQNIQSSFGTPKSPSEMPFGIIRAGPLPWAKSTALFSTKAKQSLARKASFASITSLEADDKPSQSPSAPADSQSSELPPTPTKHNALLEGRATSISPSPQHVMSRPDPRLSSQAVKYANSKLSPVPASPVSDGSNSAVEDSPSIRLCTKSLMGFKSAKGPSFADRRRSKTIRPPSVSFCSPVGKHAKLALSPVSPFLHELDRSSPRTPSETIFPPDPSSLSISGKQDRPTTRNGSEQFGFLPATPTGPREYFGNFSNRPSLNLNAPEIADVDSSLTSRFEKVDLVGTGEFSQVYRVSQPPQRSPFHFATSRSSSRGSAPGQVWAVKKSRHPYTGPKDRARKIHEVDVLKALGHHDNILNFVDSWEERSHLYIQTEFCEEGTLDLFLAQVGSKARLDDFRIWKILLELSQGLKHIHESGFIHLDLKPANILITFEGVLRIGDFGMATRWPAKPGIEGEGDREYIGPEILKGRFDKPADVFALGLIMLETAGNVELPDNGASWQKLRNGDMSDVPSLTWSSEASNILRDATGNPIGEDDDFENDNSQVILSDQDEVVRESEAAKIASMTRRGELVQPPTFMTDASNQQSLENIVRWMISPSPDDRPVTSQLLQCQGLQWVEHRRRAGATIFEGTWGPADEILAEDAEMMDV